MYTTKGVVICYSSERRLIPSGKCGLGKVRERDRVSEKENETPTRVGTTKERGE